MVGLHVLDSAGVDIYHLHLPGLGWGELQWAFGCLSDCMSALPAVWVGQRHFSRQHSSTLWARLQVLQHRHHDLRFHKPLVEIKLLLAYHALNALQALPLPAYSWLTGCSKGSLSPLITLLYLHSGSSVLGNRVLLSITIHPRVPSPCPTLYTPLLA